MEEKWRETCDVSKVRVRINKAKWRRTSGGGMKQVMNIAVSKNDNLQVSFHYYDED